MDTIKCVYCGSTNAVGTKIKGRKGRLSIKGLSNESSESTSVLQLNVQCPLCEKKYACILGAYPEFLKNHLQYTDVALGDIKRIFPRIRSLNSIITNAVGIAKLTKKIQSLRSKDYDICFKLGSKRAYLHCKKRKTLFIVVSVNGV